ncbi:MAG: zinc ribbon domain-containing protein [Caldithrix sp.]|nr:zinc ribbon domain-containing protein [Caldithrix sp.]
MPIYEFYCRSCNTIYKFFARSVNTDKIPNCPTCKTIPLHKKMSAFAVLSSGEENATDDDLPIDESKMEDAMHLLEREAGRLDENNPQQMADLMRKFSKATGMQMGPAMEEAMHRLEKGEDMESIEQDLGDSLDDDDLFRAAQHHMRKKPPKVDDTLYDL